MPSRMQMSGGKIAILFRKELTMDEFLSVVDLKGHEIATYSEPVIAGSLRKITAQGSMKTASTSKRMKSMATI